MKYSFSGEAHPQFRPCPAGGLGPVILGGLASAPVHRPTWCYLGRSGGGCPSARPRRQHMVLPTLFARFVQKSPLSVMARALLERALQAEPLDRLFAQLATAQYTRELLFSSVVELLSLVALRAFPSVRQAYRDDPA